MIGAGSDDDAAGVTTADFCVVQFPGAIFDGSGAGFVGHGAPLIGANFPSEAGGIFVKEDGAEGAGESGTGLGVIACAWPELMSRIGIGDGASLLTGS